MCKQEKKSISTWYKDICFRSRLEARFATIFETFGIRYSYEPDGVTLTNGLRYCPDFFLTFQDGQKVVLEVKGFMEDYDQAKIRQFEEDFDVKVLIGEDDLTIHYFEGEEIYLSREGLVSEMTDEMREALKRAKNYIFEEEQRTLKSRVVKDDATSALIDLCTQYLNKFFTLELGDEPRIVNPVNTPSGGDTPFKIYITKSERKDFDVSWYCGEKLKFNVAVLERQVKKTCELFWSMSMNLLDEPDTSKWRQIKENRINGLIEYLRGDEQKGGDF